MRLVLLPALVAVFVAVQSPDPGADALATDLVTHYGTHDYAAVSADVARTVSVGAVWKALERTTTQLRRKPAPPEIERRRLIVAAVSLEVAARRGMGQRIDTLSLLEWACELVRLNRPGPIEQTWHWGASAMMEALGSGVTLEVHAEHAHRRFSDDPHLVFARGLAAEIRTYPEARPGPKLKDEDVDARLAIERFRAALTHESVRAEANLRIGSVLVRLEQAQAALPYLTAAMSSTTDPYVAYLAHLNAGRADERLKRPADAIAEYREAARIIPGAQSAEFGLAAALSRTGQRAEAARISATAITRTPLPLDPWTIYGSADGRFLARIMATLREALR